MKLSNEGIDLIKSFEGCRLKAYKAVPTEKYWTIGWGHYSQDVREGQVITQQQADDIFRNELVTYETAVNKGINVPINQHQFDALVSFTYNCGCGAFNHSTLRYLTNKKDFKRAAEEFEKWNKSGGKVLAGLTRRRAAEKSLYLKPMPYTPPKIYNSIVDYLKAHKMPSDFKSRKRLAERMGMSYYSGTAEQNTWLLAKLQK